MRFRLDPGAPPAERPPPPRPSAPAPMGAPPLPAARVAREPRAKRGMVLAVALVSILLLAGGTTAGLYVAEAGPFAYPRAYLLEGDEIPSGLSLGTIPARERQGLGVSENPGLVDEEKLGNYEADDGTRPAEMWVEVLRAGTRSDAIHVLAARYASEEDAVRGAEDARSRCMPGASALLRDGDVVVLVIAGDQQALLYMDVLVRALRREAPGLSLVCGG